MGTKAAARAHKRDWNTAIADGRVVRFGDGSMRSFPASDKASMAAHEARALGLGGEVVDPSLAWTVVDPRTGARVALPPGTRRG
jgi:hypothetical protein